MPVVVPVYVNCPGSEFTGELNATLTVWLALAPSCTLPKLIVDPEGGVNVTDILLCQTESWDAGDIRTSEDKALPR